MTGAILPAPPPRPFLWPMVAIVLVFALLGPAIGGAMFLPLAAILAAPEAAPAAAPLAWIALLVGHALALTLAYGVGLAPAAATGFLYAQWDFAAPARAPRALAAALIGGLLAHGLLVWLAGIGASATAAMGLASDPDTRRWLHALAAGDLSAALRHAFVASGAVAALACAGVASLAGLARRDGAAA